MFMMQNRIEAKQLYIPSDSTYLIGGKYKKIPTGSITEWHGDYNDLGNQIDNRTRMNLNILYGELNIRWIYVISYAFYSSTRVDPCFQCNQHHLNEDSKCNTKWCKELIDKYSYSIPTRRSGKIIHGILKNNIIVYHRKETTSKMAGQTKLYIHQRCAIQSSILIDGLLHGRIDPRIPAFLRRIKPIDHPLKIKIEQQLFRRI